MPYSHLWPPETGAGGSSAGGLGGRAGSCGLWVPGYPNDTGERSVIFVLWTMAGY